MTSNIRTLLLIGTIGKPQKIANLGDSVEITVLKVHNDRVLFSVRNQISAQQTIDTTGSIFLRKQAD